VFPLFNALVALLLWVGLRSGKNFFRFVFRKTFHYTELGWYKLTRNAALFFLATAAANEAVRLGFAHAHIIALNRVFTGIDIWILSRVFLVAGAASAEAPCPDLIAYQG
jgi:intracellular septation protein